MTFKEIANLYLNSPEFLLLTSNSKRNYKSKLDTMSRYGNPVVAIVEMKVSGSTKNVYLSVYKSVLRWAEFQGISHDLPRAPYKAFKATSQDRGVWTKEEIERLHEVSMALSGGVYSNFLRACFYTGCRPSELTSLTWGQVDKDYINLMSTKRQEQSKIGRKCAIIAPIAECLRYAMGVWESLGLAPRSSDKVFRTYHTDNLNKDYALKNIKALAVDAGIEPKQLRHARSGLATAMYKAGYSIDAIQGQLGHSSIATTQRYIRPTMEERAKQYKGV